MSTWTVRLGLTLLLPSTLVSLACGNDTQTTSATDGSTTEESTTGASQTTSDPTTSTPTTTTASDPTTTADTGTTADPSTTGTTTEGVSSTTEAASSTGAEPTCDDQLQNGDETDIDCGGGDCPACPDGSLCQADSDCQSASCVDNLCGPPPPTCSDQLLNGDETDLDCGGGCSPCADNLMCMIPEDCQSKNCGEGLCVPAACDDTILNGSETDVDCGGFDCKPCEDGLACNADGDCASNSCDAGACVPPTCEDGKLNQEESDVDCGGPNCPKCGEGQACVIPADCESGSCGGGLCLAPSCMDMVQNGDETGVDCGGATCKPCSVPGLVINEVDYDSVGTDTTEFIELLNTTNAPISLAGHRVVLVNGSNNTPYTTIDISGPGMINPGQYLVIAPAAFMVPNGVLKVNFAAAQDQIQNGAPDGLILVNIQTMKALDALSYEGAMPAVNVPLVGMVSLVEGMALPMNVSDPNDVPGSLVRFPNGYDGNNAATDWLLSKTPTPGAANVQ